MIQIGVIGSSGYVAGELIRCLVHHPRVEINFLYSTSHAGSRVGAVHQDLIGHPDLAFSNTINPQVDVLFLCLGHGNSKAFLQEKTFAEHTKIIDLSQDFRLAANAHFQGSHFVYGLVELNKQAIANAQHIANPGCFATAIQLGLLPLADAGLLREDIHIHAITGSTGAGQSLQRTTHFSWRTNNLSIYKVFQHQHLDEIRQSIVSLQADFNTSINFIPVRGDFSRGIFATAYTSIDLPESELIQLYRDYYHEAAFTHVQEQSVHLKQVVNTNNCVLEVRKIDDKVLITSAIDNLLKGAAGQAIQNMNLMFGWEETTGINLKASYF